MTAEAPDPPIRVLIADDQTLLRRSLATLVDNAPDLTVIGEAGTGHDAIHTARELTPTSSSWTSACPAATASTPPPPSPATPH